MARKPAPADLGFLGSDRTCCHYTKLFGVGISLALQFPDITVEDNQIVGQELCEAPDARLDLAVQSPPHREQETQDGKKGEDFCPVHIAPATRHSTVARGQLRSSCHGPTARACILVSVSPEAWAPAKRPT